jgi:hypothetical protein
MLKRESLGARFARFWLHAPSRNGLNSASVEKIFGLGKTDTAPAVCDRAVVDKTQFSSRARNRN